MKTPIPEILNKKIFTVFLTFVPPNRLLLFKVIDYLYTVGWQINI